MGTLSGDPGFGRLADGWNARRDDCAPCTRHAEAEYAGAHERSKHLYHLDCAGLTAYSEGQRAAYNRRAYVAFQGASVVPTAARPSTPGPASLLNALPMPGPASAPAPPPEPAPSRPS